MDAYDEQALATARSVRINELPELTILFGSRARGDHDAIQSDIDIMLVSATEPDPTGKQMAVTRTERAAAPFYGHYVKAHLFWRTPDAFRRNRRYVNSIETNAVREGFTLARSPECFAIASFDADTETEYDWSRYHKSLRLAEDHLRLFEVISNSKKSELLIGQQAHSALSNAAKALIAAHLGPCRNNHNLQQMLETIRRLDPQLANLRLNIPPDVYSPYQGEIEYKATRDKPLLTDFPDYQSRTANDARRIINRAREVQQIISQEPAQPPVPPAIQNALHR